MRTQKYLTPSRQEFVLRELTAQDDEVITGANTNEAAVINAYVANCIEKGPDGKKWTSERVKALRLRDKYFLLIASRILNLGPNLIFPYKWEGDKSPTEYTEDLEMFIWDYTEELPEPGDPVYFDQRIVPYPEGQDAMYLTVGSYELRLKFLDGIGEEYLLGLKASQKTVNSEVKARSLSFKEGDEWVEVKNFSTFSQLDMVRIRAMIQDQDPQLEGLVTITHPESMAVDQIPLLAIKDFFYPVKV